MTVGRERDEGLSICEDRSPKDNWRNNNKHNNAFLCCNLCAAEMRKMIITSKDEKRNRRDAGHGTPKNLRAPQTFLGESRVFSLFSCSCHAPPENAASQVHLLVACLPHRGSTPSRPESEEEVFVFVGLP